MSSARPLGGSLDGRSARPRRSDTAGGAVPFTARRANASTCPTIISRPPGEVQVPVAQKALGAARRRCRRAARAPFGPRRAFRGSPLEVPRPSRCEAGAEPSPPGTAPRPSGCAVRSVAVVSRARHQRRSPTRHVRQKTELRDARHLGMTCGPDTPSPAGGACGSGRRARTRIPPPWLGTLIGRRPRPRLRSCRTPWWVRATHCWLGTTLWITWGFHGEARGPILWTKTSAGHATPSCGPPHLVVYRVPRPKGLGMAVLRGDPRYRRSSFGPASPRLALQRPRRHEEPDRGGAPLPMSGGKGRLLLEGRLHASHAVDVGFERSPIP